MSIGTRTAFSSILANSTEYLLFANSRFIHGECELFDILLPRSSQHLMLCETARTCRTTFQNCFIKIKAKMQQTTNTLARPINLTEYVCALVFALPNQENDRQISVSFFLSLRFLFCCTFVGQKPIWFLIFHMREFFRSLFGVALPQTVHNESHVIDSKHINSTT